jgi:hypothetical protein
MAKRPDSHYFFHNFSTFLGRRGLWLEDLFVNRRSGDKVAQRRC